MITILINNDENIDVDRVIEIFILDNVYRNVDNDGYLEKNRYLWIEECCYVLL